MRKLFETITDFPGNDNAPELPVGVQPDPAARKYRAIFISDIHLGTPGCQADALLEFLRDNDSEYLYLVGDIIDGWQLRRRWYWPQAHNDVVQKLLRKVRKGTRIVYVPGNHDEFLRDYAGSGFGGIEIHEEFVHETADGRRLLVLHGDKYDMVVANIRWLALLGDRAYDLAITLNVAIGFVRRRLGLPYWSFSGWSKAKVKRAVNYIGAYERAVADDARKANVDGVVCGHIHKAAVSDADGFLYLNCGDWVDSCTALIERSDGTVELVDWADPATRASFATASPLKVAA